MKKYTVLPNDPFYDNRCTANTISDNYLIRVTQLFDRTDLSNIKNLGYALSKYNLDTETFSPYTFLKEVDIYVFKELPESFFKSNKFLFDVMHNILINIESMQYARYSDFPHPLYWVDGNTIMDCMFNGNCLVFYALTYDYESGLFIYNPKMDRFENKENITLDSSTTKSNYENHWPKGCDDEDDDSEASEEWNYEPEDYSNEYVNLHKKNIFSCCEADNRLYILYNIETDPTDMLTEKGRPDYLGLYNPFTDDLHTIGIYKYINSLCYDGRDNILLISPDGVIKHNINTHEEMYISFPFEERIKMMLYTGIYKDRLVIVRIDYTHGVRDEIIYQIEI